MKITPTLTERIVTAVEETHLPLCSIAPYCGITYHTLRKWLRDGGIYQKLLEDGKIKKSVLNTKQKKELDLYLRVKNAQTKVKSEYLQRIREIVEKKEDV